MNMHKYVLKRILLLIPVLLGVSLLVFAIMSLTPGDPAQLILGENAPKEAGKGRDGRAVRAGAG